MRGNMRHLQIALTLTGLATIVMALAMLRLSFLPVRTVLVPPGLKTEAWIEDSHMSPSYHLEWGSYLASLALSATPSSITYQSEMLKRHVSPSIGNRFAAELEANVSRLKRMQASTFFEISQALARPDEGKVAFIGFLSTYVQDRKVNEQQKSYAMTFEVVNGHPLLKSFRETAAHDPFGDNEDGIPFSPARNSR